MTSQAVQRGTEPQKSPESYQNPPHNYALHSVRLAASINLLGWAMRDKKWGKAEELLKQMREDQDALESFVSGKLHPTTLSSRP